MVHLSPMTEAEFRDFLERNIAEYAAEKVRSGNWTPEESQRRSRQEHAQLLPEGLATPDQRLLSIRQVAGEPQAGTIWMAVEHHDRRMVGFVYDLFVHQAYRRRGIALGAMHELERLGRELGLESLGLHVFAHNTAARALYERLDYEPTNINLSKRLKR